MSSLYESWITRLKVSWMGKNAQRIFGGFAAALGDKSYDWAFQGVLEHLPVTASSPSLQLIASERQLATALAEAASSLAAREPYASWIHKFDGTPLGVLLGLHFAGFDGAYVIQQNGRQYSLTLPLPAFGSSTWDPTPNLVVANTCALSSPLSSPTKGHADIPIGTPWFALDNNPDLVNRFAILFPSWPFSALVPVFFNNTDSVAVTWPVQFASATYNVIIGPPTDGVEVYNDGTAQTATGTTIKADASWYGVVWVTAFPDGVNPLNTFSAESAALMQRVITLCRPEKSYCSGAFTITTGGRTWDYFPGGTTWDGGTYPTWDTNTVSQVLGAF